MPADATGQAGTQETGAQANGWFTGLAWALYALSAACGVKARPATQVTRPCGARPVRPSRQQAE